MKRTLSLILAILLTLSVLAGCGDAKTPETSDPIETTEAAEPTTEPTEPSEPSVPETTVPETVPETTAPMDEPESTTPVLEERPLTLGVVDGSTYTNSYAGFGFTLGEGWSILPADQLQELPEQVKDAVAGTQIGDAMQNVQQFTDVMAENANEFVSMNVLMQKVGAQEMLMYMMLSEEDLLDTTLTQKDAMIDAYSAMGMTVSSMEKVTVTFLGEEHFALKTVAETQGVACYMLQLFDYNQGEYSITLTLSSYLEDKTDSMLDLFFAVE